MAWGAPRGVDDWVERLNAQDPTLVSLHVFKSRRFGTEVGEVQTRNQPSFQLCVIRTSKAQVVAGVCPYSANLRYFGAQLSFFRC